MFSARYLFFICMLLSAITVGAQHNFHKLSVENGLHDGTIRCIGQDKLGYIWIGSVGALNRFDGRSVRQFTNIPGDTTSPYGSQPRSIYSNTAGRLWIGFESGLTEFDFQHSSFKRIEAFKDQFVGKILSCNDSILYIISSKGFFKYNIKTGASYNFSTSLKPGHAALLDNPVSAVAIKSDSLFMATQNGVVIMHINERQAVLIPVPVLQNIPLRRIAVDKYSNIWIGTHGEIKLVKLHADLKTAEVYDRFLTSAVNTQPLNVMGILTDSKNRIWVITAIDGLLEYQEDSNSFIKHLHDNNVLSSPSGNNYRTIFQDKHGTIWLGADVRGVNYFEPDKSFFKTIFPFPDRLDERDRAVGRAVTEDKDGNLWMGNHDGVTNYNIKTGKYTVWRNEKDKKPVIYSNLVRSIQCDNENNIWIGTGSGVNKYNNTTHRMEFIASKDLPLSFYNAIIKDKSGNIWFCTNDAGSLFWYSVAEKKFYNIEAHPQLKKYKGFGATSYLMEDSKNRLWISISGKGVLMFDKVSLSTKHYMANDSVGTNIIGNQVVDIKEDRDGLIWVTSFNGFTGIDVERNKFISFNKQNGLAGNITSALAIDRLNRIWVGVSGGLVMLDKDRKQLTTFNLNDGLSSIGFPEHAGIVAANGDIIFPSYNGFIRFNPADYTKKKNHFNFYVDGYSIFNKEYPAINETEQDPALHLKANENSFTFNLVALNYINPNQTWFAYKLQNFEKDWHYTRDPRAVYTNIPGSRYTFLYKAAAGNNNWDEIVAKKITIELKTVFYKTIWFLALAVLLFAGIVFGIYQYRSRQKQQLYNLESKAQLLEKEKAMVMYENLKQQLNPHFLFNSLSSLRSLIRIKPTLATEFLDGLSKTYRYLLRSGDTELVSLKEELDFVQTFVLLQKTRFDEGLQLSVNIPEELLTRRIAPVTIQGLIENAIKHNMVDDESPLMIEIFSEQENIIVRNNLQKIAEVETSNKKGLVALKTLYSYYTDKPLTIQEDEKYFTVIIPLI